MYLALLNIKIFATQLLFAADNTCEEGGGADSFFGFPTWYKYLPGRSVEVEGNTICSPHLTGINDLWLIGLAILEILLRIAILVAIVFVLVGGIKFITARGDTGGPGKPDKIASAQKTVVDALVGLVIAVVATAVVSYLGGRFS